MKTILDSDFNMS